MLFTAFERQSASLFEQPCSKIANSQGTDISDHLPLSKQISLSSCASSMSINQDIQPSKDNQLFARFLFSSNSSEEKQQFENLKNHYLSSLKFEGDQILKLIWFNNEQIDQEGRILEHFIMSWLQHMGYGSNSNRKYFVSRVKFMGGHQFAHNLTKIYRNLTLLGLSRKELRSFLLYTCKNGWEYFIKQILNRVASQRCTSKV